MAAAVGVVAGIVAGWAVGCLIGIVSSWRTCFASVRSGPDRTTIGAGAVGAAVVVVVVVGVRVDGVVDVAVGRDGGAAGVVGAGDQVEEVAGDGVGDEGFAVFVPIHAPGVGEAVAEDFEDFSRGVIAP